MTPEEWKKGIQDWQQSGGREGAKAAPADTPSSDSGGGWLDTAGSFFKGAGRELATQGGFAKDFAQGGDPNSTPEWLGREAVDFAPGVLLDIAQPELGLPAMIGGRVGRFAAETAGAGIKGALGGAAANPNDRKGGAQTGAEVGAGSSAIGQVMSSRPVHRMLLPAAILAEIAQHGGMIPHDALGGLYPWAMAHGLSALGGLARAAGFKAPGTIGAAGSQAQQYMDQNSQ